MALKRALTPGLNPAGYTAAAGAIYAAAAMIYNAHYNHGVINTAVIIAAVAAVLSLLTRQIVTPVKDPRDGNGKPLSATVVAELGELATGLEASAERRHQPPPELRPHAAELTAAQPPPEGPHVLERETTRIPGRRLGMRPTDPARRENAIAVRLTGTLPAYPPTVEHLAAVPRWMLGGNDRFGTCGPTGVANYAVMQYAYLTGEAITVTDAAMFDLYRRSGNPGFNPATGADDNGVDMTVMLSALAAGGIEITRASGQTETIRPYCWASVPLAETDLHAATAIFGGVLLGATLDTAQQAQTDQHLWDYRASAIWGGHAFMGGSYTGSAAAHTRDATVVTWAELVGTTDAFTSHQIEEAYVPVFPVLWNSAGFQAGVDTAQLAADYTEITGKPFTGPDSPPVPPVPPSPPPPPTPPPVVPPTTDPALLTFAGEVAHWMTAERTRPDLIALRASIARLLAAEGLGPPA